MDISNFTYGIGKKTHIQFSSFGVITFLAGFQNNSKSIHLDDLNDCILAHFLGLINISVISGIVKCNESPVPTRTAFSHSRCYLLPYRLWIL